MYIRKNTSNKPLLTIDDPSIYRNGQDSAFINAQIVGTTESCTEENVLYLVGTNNNYTPCVKKPSGGVEVLPNPFSKGPTLPYPDAATLSELNDNLVAIDNHLYALRKELSYWNLYEISYSVENANDFSATLAMIGPGEAMIINVDGILKYEGIDYSRGDIIVRLTDGTYTTIQASTSGFYFPSKVERDGDNFILTYSYWQQQSVEADPAELIPGGSPLDKPHQTEYFEIPVTTAGDSFMYGIRQDMSGTASTHTFAAVIHENSTNPIPPIIKFFTETGEEVALDFTCPYTSGSPGSYTVSITNNSKPSTLKYVYIK